jgi:hypothetical protein
MQMERQAIGPRRLHRARWRGWLLAPGVALLLGLVLWGALSGPDRRPSERPFGAGLPPRVAERGMPPTLAPDPDPTIIARRAEIAAEEARLAALRAARLELEREVAALEQETAARRSLPPPQEPGMRPMRVVVHHRANSTAASGAAAELAQSLRGGGFEVQGVRSAAFVPSTPVVRFFHEEDQAAAARLAARLGRGWAIQDFRAFLPQPAPQTLEVWLAAE